MVSFDVKSLFTNVPIDEALKVARRKLQEDELLDGRTTLSPDDVVKLLEVCLTTTYFIYDSEYYEQLHGAAMGSPISPVIANLFMEHFESLAVDERMRFWKRYVDDVFCVLKKNDLDDALHDLNSLFPSIQFTVETEKEGSLPFLDVLVNRQEDGSFTTSVYRKPTHSDRYLAYQSNHPLHVKRGVVKCLFDRAYELCDEVSLTTELKHIRRVLVNNGYPINMINMMQRRRQKKKDDSIQSDPLSTAVIPYIPGLSENLRRILWDYGIRTAFKTTNTLANILTKVKDRTPLQLKLGAVYQINCDCGNFYIGETGRTLDKRLKEHEAACRYGYWDRSPIAEHAWQEGHTICWADVKLLDRADNMLVRRVKEAIHINLAPQNLRINRDKGLELSPLILRAAR